MNFESIYANFEPPSSIPDAKEVDRKNSYIVTGQDACAKLVTIEGREFYLKEGVQAVTLGREDKKDCPNYF